MLGFTIIWPKPNRQSAIWATNKAINHLRKALICTLLLEPLAGRKARQRHHQGTLPPGGQNLPDHPQPGGTGHSPCHRGSLGPGRFGYSAKILRLYSIQHQRQAHQFGIHRPDCGQAAIAVKVSRGGAVLKAWQGFSGFLLMDRQTNE